MIAYHYPPVAGSSGVQRTLKFSAYLRQFGWEPLVLTVDPRAYEQVTTGQLAEVPVGAAVERAFALDTARHLSLAGRYPRALALPDRWVSWWPMGVWSGLRLIRQHRPSVIMSTFPIATAHLIGKTLARLSGLPWVADFRDGMTDTDYPRDPRTRRRSQRLEAEVVHRCSKAVFTTRGTMARYAARYPALPESRWAVIENGFDEENFLAAERALPARAHSQRPGPLRLVHSGILYPQERDPRPFFEAVRRLKMQGTLSAETVRITLRATGSDGLYAPMLRALDIEDIVSLAASVSYREALQEMLSADGLLLFQAAVCNQQIPAKLYEYMRAGRPIFALTDPSGDTAAVLRSSGTGTLCNIADANDIAAQLTAFLGALGRGETHGAERGAADQHSRLGRTAELARLLDELALSRNQP
ncbi:MAG: glycosyltransferase [Leptothrix sp. (in: Bacteria)]|nr:glycosyltransferase [Leptothrix sp. (in: b-proteobacteria)]